MRTPGQDLTGLTELEVTGLPVADAGQLLDSALRRAARQPGARSDRRRDHGNPLALFEVPRGLTPAELAGGYGIPDVAGAPASMEETFRLRVEAMPDETRRLLVLAAADPTGDPAWSGVPPPRLGIDTDAAIPAAEQASQSSVPGCDFAIRWCARRPTDRRRRRRNGRRTAPWQRPSTPTPTLSGVPGTELTRYPDQMRTSRASWNVRPIWRRRVAG